MTSPAPHLWRHSARSLALLLACLGMLGPFAIDTYLPAFDGIARSIGASPVQMQQTLSAFLFGFALMNLFHGALADSFGRRPVVLWGMSVFTLASVGCALSSAIGPLVFFRLLQGLSCGAGMVVSRALIRDLYPPAQAQRVMSQVTIYFGVAPAIAPLVGGFLYVHTNWHVIFWFLALVGGVLTLLNWRYLPETLPAESRQRFAPRPLLAGYAQMVASPRFMALVLASGVPFNGLFLYVLASPAWLGGILGLPPQHFFWFFFLSVAGIVGGAWWSGRMAGRTAPRRQVRIGFALMGTASAVNVAANALFEPHVAWALFPVAVFSLGWALMVPVVTLLVLDAVPERRGMASSVQAAIGSAANGLVAGALVPLVMHSALALAVASAALMGVGVVAWSWVKRRLPVPPASA